MTAAACAFALPGGAIFSADRARRLLLWRVWAPSLPLLGFIALHPSRADENKNDSTTTRSCERAPRASPSPTSLSARPRTS